MEISAHAEFGRGASPSRRVCIHLQMQKLILLLTFERDKKLLSLQVTWCPVNSGICCNSSHR